MLRCAQMLLVCFGLMLSLPAAAFSRIVVMGTGSSTVTLDGIRQTSISGRTVIYPVSAGRHVLAVLDSNGTVLQQEALQVDDGVQVKVVWTKGAPFKVTGASSSGSVAAAEISEHDTPTGVASTGRAIAPAPGGGTTSRGSLGPASGPRPSDLTTPRSNTPTSPPSSAKDAAYRAVRSMTHGAQSGTSFGKGGRAFRQKVKRANVIFGTVHLFKTSGPACRVYHDGMLLAELDAGESSVAVSLEVGRRPLEIRGMDDHALWHQGELMVDQTHTVQLGFDLSTPPTPRVRPWLWHGL